MSTIRVSKAVNPHQKSGGLVVSGNERIAHFQSMGTEKLSLLRVAPLQKVDSSLFLPSFCVLHGDDAGFLGNFQTPEEEISSLSAQK